MLMFLALVLVLPSVTGSECVCKFPNQMQGVLHYGTLPGHPVDTMYNFSVSYSAKRVYIHPLESSSDIQFRLHLLGEHKTYTKFTNGTCLTRFSYSLHFPSCVPGGFVKKNDYVKPYVTYGSNFSQAVEFPFFSDIRVTQPDCVPDYVVYHYVHIIEAQEVDQFMYFRQIQTKYDTTILYPDVSACKEQ